MVSRVLTRLTTHVRDAQVKRFAELVARESPPLDLACLAIAAGADPRLDEARWLAELDRLADGVRDVDSLVDRLFVREGFTGNARRYDDPRNSLLHTVLARRTGIPITLAVVCLEVGRRAGVALEGVGMPGHFLVRAADTGELLDPFGGGARVDLDGAERLFRAATGAGLEVQFGPDLLAATPVPAILARVLQNLRVLYRRRGQAVELAWVLGMRLALPGVTATDVAELGAALGRSGAWRAGAQLLEARAGDFPREADALRYAARSLLANLN